MKRTVIFLFAFFIMFMNALTVFAQQDEELDLIAERVKTKIGNTPERGPVNAPSASIDDHTFYINESHPDYVLQLVDPDDNGIVVYQVLMPAGVNSVMLPSWTVGEYVIQLLWSEWRFWGYIELE